MGDRIARPSSAFIFLMFLVGAFTTTLWHEAQAQQVEIKGTSSAILSGKCIRDNNVRGKRDKETFDETLQRAKVNSVRRHVANSGIAVANAYDAKKAEIAGNIDDYLLNPNIRVVCEKGTKNLQIAVTGELNKSAFDRTLALNQIAMKERSRLTSIFVARRQSEIKAFDARRTDVKQREEVIQVIKEVGVSDNDVMSGEIENFTNLNEQRGGNFNYKADEIKYQTFRPDGLETATNEIFVSLGYRPINNSQVEAISKGKFNVGLFEEEFASNENISNATLSNAFEAISGIIPLLVIARLDVGAPIRDRGNEEPIVVVDVKAQVYRYDGLFFETVGSFGPVQIKSAGIASTAAENNAILEASREAASQLGAQLLQNNIF